jgi:hypothetical protein
MVLTSSECSVRLWIRIAMHVATLSELSSDGFNKHVVLQSDGGFETYISWISDFLRMLFK